MWIPKWLRDRKKGVDTAMPTQVVSNEEFIPRPQNKQQRQVEDLIMRMSEEKSRRLGIDRRAFMASSMGMATICVAVLTLPRNDTAMLFDCPICAIHSRSAEMVISRPMMISAMIASTRFNCTSTINAAATISLSATGSRNAPNAEV